MKKLVLFLAIVGVVMGCGDERGANDDGTGGDDFWTRTDGIVRFDVDVDSLDKECVYTSKNSTYGDVFLLEDYLVDEVIEEGGSRFSVEFSVNTKMHIEEFEERIVANDYEAIAAIESMDVYFSVYGATGKSADFTLFEHIGDKVIELEKVSVIIESSMHDEDLHFKSIDPKIKKTYTIEVEASEKLGLFGKQQIIGRFVDAECL